MTHTLLVAISAHGYGHAAQTACVVNALRRRYPQIHLQVHSDLPRDYLETRFTGAFEHHRANWDIGLKMASALEVRVEESAQAYARFHHHWRERVGEITSLLGATRPRLVLANVPYAVLVAARDMGIPSLALCSLNWADIYLHYCGRRPEALGIAGQIRAAYCCAERFLRVTPGMPMEDLPNRQKVGPIALLGKNRRTELHKRLNLPRDTRLGLVGLGGVVTHLPRERWPAIPNLYWLVPDEWGNRRGDMFTMSRCAMPFIDLMHSCDLLLSKPGYGSFVEAACNGVPVLYIERRDWPEERFLTEWLHANGVAARLSRDQLASGAWCKEVEWALTAPTHNPRPNPTGIDQCVSVIERYLDL